MKARTTHDYLQQRALLVALVAALSFSGAACGSHESGHVDDAGLAADAPTTQTPSLPTTLEHTSGGGPAVSPGYRAYIQIGGPQPRGRAASQNHGFQSNHE